MDNAALKQDISGYDIATEGILHFPDFRRNHIEWLDDETCRLLRRQEIPGTDVPVPAAPVRSKCLTSSV